MVTRIVKLTIAAHHVETFIEIFSDHRAGIGAFEGCLELNVYQDSTAPQIIFTISRWENQHYLDAYRYSVFFKKLWSQVKPLFAARAEAHSITIL